MKESNFCTITRTVLKLKSVEILLWAMIRETRTAIGCWLERWQEWWKELHWLVTEEIRSPFLRPLMRNEGKIFHSTVAPEDIVSMDMQCVILQLVGAMIPIYGAKVSLFQISPWISVRIHVSIELAFICNICHRYFVKEEKKSLFKNIWNIK